MMDRQQEALVRLLEEMNQTMTEVRDYVKQVAETLEFIATITDQIHGDVHPAEEMVDESGDLPTS